MAFGPQGILGPSLFGASTAVTSQVERSAAAQRQMMAQYNSAFNDPILQGMLAGQAGVAVIGPPDYKPKPKTIREELQAEVNEWIGEIQ